MITSLTDDPAEAARVLRAGGLVAFPTETVYGLGADALDEAAVEGIFRAKGRPADNPVIVHVPSVDQLDRVTDRVPLAAHLILEHFAPGPVTVVVPRARNVPSRVSAGLDTVGVRIPSHETARAFLAACGRPVAAPSANRSGRPSPTTWDAVLADLDGLIDCVLRGPRSHVGLESTVVDCTRIPPVILRAGSISVEALRDAIGEVRLAGSEDADLTRSPGTRHPHYAPRAAVRIVDDLSSAQPSPRSAFIGTAAPPDGYALTRVVAGVEAYAHELYDFFRRCDALGLDRIDCQRMESAGLGLALMDRIERSAAR